MNIPDKVRIGSMNYKVSITDEILLVDHRECKGLIDYEMHEIKIKKDIQDKQGMEETILHEIVHGVVYERNFAFENNDNETITEELARGLHQVIKDNPEIFLEANQVKTHLLTKD